MPAVLEMLGIPYSGSDPLTLAASLDKVMAKRLVQIGHGRPIPPGMDTARPTATRGARRSSELLFDDSDPVHRWGEAETAPPLILKPALEGSSKGIRGHCIAENADEAIEVYRRLAADYDQPILAEEFIEGDEVTLGLVGNSRETRGGNAFVIGAMRILPRRSDGRFVYSLEVKRDWRNQVDYETPADLPDPVVAALTLAALDVSAALQCRDLARIDFRVRDGVPYFIEANPLPGLAPVTSDLVILAQGHGIGYSDLIRRVFHAGVVEGGAEAVTGRRSRVAVLYNAPTLPADHPDSTSEADVVEVARTVVERLVKRGYRRLAAAGDTRRSARSSKSCPTPGST